MNKNKPPVNPYHRIQEERALSALQENARRRAEYEKNLAEHAERILDLEAVMTHLAKPKAEDIEPYFETRVPSPKNRQDLCKNFFLCNIWDVEPVLLDELLAAKKEQNPERIETIRKIIRAASWMKHERTDAKKAVEIAKEQAKRFQEDHRIKHAMLTESGFEKDAERLDADLVAIESVIESLQNFHDIGPDVETNLLYVERELDNDWDAFLTHIKQEKAEWPENPGVELVGSVADYAERIKAWRIIRDQLYYQRYNINLSKIGQLHSQPKNPFSET